MAPRSAHLRLVSNRRVSDARVSENEATRTTESPTEMPTIEEAFRLYSRYVAYIGLKILGRSGEVEDLVQDVFLEAHRYWHTVEEPNALRVWLGTITVRVARRRLKARRVRALVGLEFRRVDELAVPDTGASPADRALLRQVYDALDRVPADERVAFCLRVLNGEQLDQVAVLCGCSLATAKRRIAAAQTAVRKAVGDG